MGSKRRLRCKAKSPIDKNKKKKLNEPPKNQKFRKMILIGIGLTGAFLVLMFVLAVVS